MPLSTHTPPDDVPPSALLDVRAVAAMLGCSPRHAYRLADAGRLPAPVKLGSLIRWRRAELEKWLETGCPSCEEGRNDGSN